MFKYIILTLIELCNLGPKQGQIQECKKGKGGGGVVQRDFPQKGREGGPTTYSGLEINKTFSKRGGEGSDPLDPLDLFNEAREHFFLREVV